MFAKISALIVLATSVLAANIPRDDDRLEVVVCSFQFTHFVDV